MEGSVKKMSEKEFEKLTGRIAGITLSLPNRDLFYADLKDVLVKEFGAEGAARMPEEKFEKLAGRIAGVSLSLPNRDLFDADLKEVLEKEFGVVEMTRPARRVKDLEAELGGILAKERMGEMLRTMGDGGRARIRVPGGELAVRMEAGRAEFVLERGGGPGKVISRAEAEKEIAKKPPEEIKLDFGDVMRRIEEEERKRRMREKDARHHEAHRGYIYALGRKSEAVNKGDGDAREYHDTHGDRRLDDFNMTI